MRTPGGQAQSIRCPFPQTLYGSLARDALALCCCLEAKAEAKKPSGEGQEKHLRLWLNGGTSGGLMPLYLTNEVRPCTGCVPALGRA